MRKTLSFFLCVLCVLCVFAGCSGGAKPITIALSLTSATVQASGTMQFTATVANDSANKGVSWSVTCSAAQCGSVSPTATQSGMPTTYTAPAVVPSSDLTVTITVTSVADSTKKGTITVTVPAITVTVAPGTLTVNAGTTGQFTATVANDPANAGVTWSVTCSVAQCGSVSPTTTPSGTHTTYTAPSSPPTTTLTVTITAKSVTDTTKSNSATITVPAVTISVAPPAPMVLVGATQNFTATVANTSNTAVTWKLTQGGAACTAACGTLSSATTNPVTYTPPTGAGNLTITITATSAADTTKSASATITVPAITVSVAPTSAQVAVSGFTSFTATVGNDGASKGVTWSLTQGGAACAPAVCGTINAGPTASGAGTTYQAPPSMPANPNVTVTATSVTDPSKTASATVIITPISVSVSPTTASVVVNGTQQFTATVTFDVRGFGVDWTISLGGAPCPLGCGSVSPMRTPSGTLTTYTAPSTVPSGVVTLTATSVADSSKSASATITVTAAPPISVSVAPSTASVAINGTQSFTATVTNDSAAAGVTWTLTQSGVACSPACGTVSPASGTGNSPMTTYTAPATVPTPATVTITATSVTDTTKSGSATITVTAGAAACGSGHESVLLGQYAFLFQGFDANGPVTIAGTFSADGTGKIALLVGEEDINDSTSTQLITPTSITSAGSSYSVGADHRGCLTIATGSGTSTYRISLGSLNGSSIATRGRMIEFDNSGTLGSGVLRLQDSTAFLTSAISGGYAFGASSTTSLSTTMRNRFAVVGAFTTNGTGGITAGELDFNSNGTVDAGTAGPISIQNTSTYSVSTSGRATFTFNLPAGLTVHGIFYVVSANEALAMSADAQSVNSPFGGSVLKQSGSFSTSSISGNNVVYSEGLCGGCGPGGTVAPNLTVAVINITSPGNFTLTGDQNKGGTVTSQTFSGTYTVDSSGRLLVSSTSGGGVIYLVSSSQGGYFASAGNDVGAGFVEPQTGGPFMTSSVSGTFSFGTTGQVEQNVSDNSGVATFDGVSTVSGTSDSASIGSTPSTPNLSAGNAFSQPYSVTNGTGTPGRGTITMGGATNLIFYIISPSKAVLLGAQSGNTNPSIIIGEK
jgi:hypothetical protein